VESVGGISGISKTERLLGVFHLLKYCREVSFREITDQMRVSKKTACRDIALLRGIGCGVVFSRELGAFVMDKASAGQRDAAARFPENKTQRLYREKILRLITLMDEMEGADDPAEWYRARFPALSARTMQRDFRLLNAIGYRVTYQRERNEWNERERGKYYCEWPGSTYGLELFHRRSL
jgi:predicted DNA-binding transcriptional regulator YafY